MTNKSDNFNTHKHKRQYLNQWAWISKDIRGCGAGGDGDSTTGIGWGWRQKMRLSY